MVQFLEKIWAVFRSTFFLFLAAQSPQMSAIDASRAELSIDACIDGVCMGAFPSNLGLRVTALLFGRGIRDSLIG